MTGFKNIKKLLPGEIRIYTLDGNFIKSTKIKKRNFNLIEHNPENTRSLIISSVKEHLNSDLKVSSLLSGGLDSSIITYEAKNLLGNIESFTAYQEDPSKDEDVIHSRILCNKIGIKIILLRYQILIMRKYRNP